MSYIRLATKGCPGTYCDDESCRIIYWNHICGNNSYLDRHGNVHCFKCNTQYPIFSAFFDCQKCQQFGIPGYTSSKHELNIDSKQYKICDYLSIFRRLLALSVLDDARKIICDFNKAELADFLNDVTHSLYSLR